MNSNFCNTCGNDYEYKNGHWRCRACGSYKPEELSNEEVTLLYTAFQKLRQTNFVEAEEDFDDIVQRFPENPEGHWGRLLSRYDIKYEKDYNGSCIPTCCAPTIKSITTDPSYQNALKYANEETRQFYTEQAAYIERVRKEWVEKARKEKPYDIFISYKESKESTGSKESDLKKGAERTEDSIAVQELYIFLTGKGYRVFYSRESLRDKQGEKYEPYIFNALSTAKVMLVYGSKAEYITSTWVKNEWTRYLKRMAAGEKDPASLLVAYDGFSVDELPRVLSSRQSFDANDRRFYSDLEETVRRLTQSKPMTVVPPLIPKMAKTPKAPKPPKNPPPKKEPKPPKEKPTPVVIAPLSAPPKDPTPAANIPVVNRKRIITPIVISAGIILVAGIGITAAVMSSPKTSKPDAKPPIVHKDTTVAPPVDTDPVADQVITEKEETTKHIEPDKEPETEPDTESQETETEAETGPKVSEGLALTKKKDGTYEVLTLGSCTDTDLIIPSSFKGISITSIGEYAFQDCSNLTSVIIPDSVTGIGSYAFSNCRNLTSAIIPDSVTSIDHSAFRGCTSLTSVTISANLTSIGTQTFAKCSSLTTVTIPNSVTSIGNYAFSECTNLTSITIPDSVTDIGDYTFSECTNLASIAIPDSVTTIGKYAFSKCTNLTSITIPASIPDIGIYWFNECTSLTSIIIPDNMTSIGNYAFNGCSGLSSVTIGNHVTRIGDHAFSNCSNLTSIIIPDSVTIIDGNAFSACTGLTSITIPSGTTDIGFSAFSDCTGLRSVIIPTDVTQIRSYAFSDCTGLTDIYYTGTEDQWNSITKGNKWDSNTGNYTIHYNHIPEE